MSSRIPRDEALEKEDRIDEMKQVAQRATIAHLSPMCQGQILFKKSGDTDVLDAQGQLTP